MSKKSDITIAEKLDALNKLVIWFESDEFNLEQAFDQFEKAESLGKDIEKELNEFKHKISVLSKNFSEPA